MQKTRVEKEKQGKLLSVLAALDAQALQGVLEGARYRIRRPRVRQANREVALPTLAQLQAQDLLDEQMRHRMVLGVSTRNYKQVIDGYTEKLGVARSSVSRAFVRASQKDLDSINAGPLGEYAFVAVMIEGLEIGGRMVVAALGITADMTKIPLGLREGNTENSEVVRDLLASIQERGFTLHCERRLAVIDGAKALKKALRQVFGERVLLQRCWLHKLRPPPTLSSPSSQWSARRSTASRIGKGAGPTRSCAGWRRRLAPTVRRCAASGGWPRPPP